MQLYVTIIYIFWLIINKKFQQIDNSTILKCTVSRSLPHPNTRIIHLYGHLTETHIYPREGSGGGNELNFIELDVERLRDDNFASFANLINSMRLESSVDQSHIECESYTHLVANSGSLMCVFHINKHTNCSFSMCKEMCCLRTPGILHNSYRCIYMYIHLINHHPSSNHSYTNDNMMVQATKTDVCTYAIRDIAHKMHSHICLFTHILCIVKCVAIFSTTCGQP